MAFNHIVAVAKRKAKREGWEPYKFEWIDDQMLVQGSVPVGVYKSGKKKGRFKWDRNDATAVILSKTEIADEEKRYEADTGLCSGCYGKKQTAWSWSVTEGTKYRDCRKCGGTGQAKGGAG